MAKVDLGNYQDKDVRVFAGRDRGANARRATKLDEYDTTDETVEVRIPPETFAMNSSYFLAMFGQSIRALGAEGFKKKYRFTGKDIKETIESGIKDALHDVKASL
jgi:hypothetical protein